MKTFLDHIKEEVVPTALSGGTIDINNPAVRAEINGILAAINSRSCITPYVALTKIRKALSYFHIELPGKSYMQGDHGVEVWEIHQFGHKMGMTNDGEFVKEVPCEYYLFFHYHLFGSMFMIDAKVVDKADLDKRLSAAESMIKEDAAARQELAKATAPKEKAHTALGDCDCSQGDSPSTKSAVDTSQRKSDKKLSAGKLDETHADNIRRKYRQKEDDNDHTGNVHLMTRVFGSKKERETSKGLLQKRNKQGYVSGSDSKKGYDMTKDYARRMEKLKEEETVEEGRMPPSVIKHKQKLANMTPEEKAKKFAGKSEEQLKSMARRHGYGKDSTEYSKHKKLDEKLTKSMPAGDVISDFVHSKDKTFKGDTKKERISRALGAYYGMHPEKSRKE